MRRAQGYDRASGDSWYNCSCYIQPVNRLKRPAKNPEVAQRAVLARQAQALAALGLASLMANNSDAKSE